MRRALWIAVMLSAAGCADDFGGHLTHNPEVPNDPLVASIGGMVLESGTGVAIKGATVSAAGDTTSSAADGRYEIIGITTKVIVLEASMAGYQPRSVQLPMNAGHNTYPLVLQQLPD